MFICFSYLSAIQPMQQLEDPTGSHSEGYKGFVYGLQNAWMSCSWNS